MTGSRLGVHSQPFGVEHIDGVGPMARRSPVSSYDGDSQTTIGERNASQVRHRPPDQPQPPMRATALSRENA